MNSSFGLEALQQRGRSAFYEEMITLFTNLQDALYEAKSVSDDDIRRTASKINFNRKLKAIIVKYTGFEIDYAGILKSRSPNAGAIVHKVKEKSSPRSREHQTSGMILANYQNRYNDRAGRLLPSLDPKQEKVISVTVYCTTGLLKLRTSGGKFVLTPEELAAFMMHEIGHVDVWYRIEYRCITILQDTSDIVDYLNDKPEPDKITALANVIQERPEIQKVWGPTLQVVLKNISDIRNHDDQKYLEALSVLSKIAMLISADDCAQLMRTTQSVDYQRRKTTIFSVDTERAADDFATRHGTAGPLISALAKLDQLSTNDTRRFIEQVVGVDIPAILLIRKMFKLKFSLIPEQVSGGYDPLIRRLELIVETAKHAFHDDALPEEIAKQMRQDIEEAQQLVGQYNSAEYRKLRVTINEWRENVVKFGRLIAFPYIDRRDQDYDRLHNAARSLSRHSLYYLAKK